MKYKLIAIDMDGTLLNSENQVSKRNREALYKAMEKGIYVVLTTGRILPSAFYYGKSMNLDNPIIACNGAIISNGGVENIIYKNKMNLESSKEIVKLADKYKIHYHFYDKNTFYTSEVSEGIEQYYPSFPDALREQGIEVEILENVLETLEEEKTNIYKFVFIEDDLDKLSKFRGEINNLDGIQVSSSWYNNLEIMNEGVSKGSSLEYLGNKLNIGKSQIMAIGDNENDISMLKIAGLAVAMENGDDAIKKYSHTVTHTNDEDGVAKAIEKYILNS